MYFNLFKSKPLLKELIPEGFVDIHSHILPGIDDGAKNIEESLKLISEMKKMGFSKIIGTPHVYTGLYENTNETILNSYNLIENIIDEKIKIKYAAEYLIDNTIIAKANDKTLLTIKDSFVLVEFSFAGMQINIEEILFELQINGYIPVLAHPERYDFLFNDNNHKLLFKLKDLGCNFQLNLLSLIGYYGRKVSDQAEKLIKFNIYDFSGSDIHNKNQINLFGNKIKIRDSSNLKKLMDKNVGFI